MQKSANICQTCIGYSCISIDLFHQGLGGVTSLVNAVTEYSNAFNDVIDTELSLVVAKENIGTCLNYGELCGSVYFFHFKFLCVIVSINTLMWKLECLTWSKENWYDNVHIYFSKIYF